MSPEPLAALHSGVLFEGEAVPDYARAVAESAYKSSAAAKTYRELQPILWDRVAGHVAFNLMSVYAVWLAFTEAKLLTTAWGESIGCRRSVAI